MRRHQPVPQLLLGAVVLHLQCYPPEEGPQGLQSQGHQRVEGNTEADEPVRQGPEPNERHRQPTHEFKPGAYSWSFDRRAGKGMRPVLL